MKKFLIPTLLLLGFFLIPSLLFAREITPEEAMLAAERWAAQNNALAGDGGAALTPIAVKNDAGATLYYKVPLKNKGVVIVSCDTNIDPVIAVLPDATSAELPEGHPLTAILNRDLTQRRDILVVNTMKYATANASAEKALQAIKDEANTAWDNLLVAPKMADKTAVTASKIIRLIDSSGAYQHWEQGAPYNNLCPVNSTGSRSVAGCVAIAGSIILQHYKVPGGIYKNKTYYVQGSSRSGYTTGATYNWTSPTSTTYANVAYDVGLCSGMNYGPSSGSSSEKLSSAFVNDFGFKTAYCATAYERDAPRTFTEAEVEAYIYGQLRGGAPVVLGLTDPSRGGHEVVAMGYGETSAGVPCVKIYCGWGGSGDAWYKLPERLSNATTTGTINPSPYNYSLLDEVITCISYSNDNCVAIYGQVKDSSGNPLANKTVTIKNPSGSTVATVTTGTYGHYGTRISYSYNSCTVTVEGTTKTLDLSQTAYPPETNFSISSSSSKPDLAPYTPNSSEQTWSDSLLLSTKTGATTSSSTFTSSDTIYLSYAVANLGTGSAPSFNATVSVDNAVVKTLKYTGNALNSGYYVSWSDISIGKLSVGSHTIKIVIDPDNAIAETNESNNTVSKVITVASAGGTVTTLNVPVPASGGTVTSGAINNASGEKYQFSLSGKPSWITGVSLKIGTNTMVLGTGTTSTSWSGNAYLSVTTAANTLSSSRSWTMKVPYGSSNTLNVEIKQSAASASVPSAPTGVSASDGTYTDKVVVTWNSVSGATSYNIYRGTSSSSSSATTLKSGVTGTSYNDTSSVAGKTYYYWVKAVNSAGTSGFSSSNTGYRATSGGGGHPDMTVGGIHWTGSGDAAWTVTNSTSGKFAATSGKITHSQSTSLTASVSGTGKLTFQWKVSSEAVWDKLTVYTDGTANETISGMDATWVSKTITLGTAGSHTIKWTYSKDGSENAGSDCGWIQNVTWTPTQTTSFTYTTSGTTATVTGCSGTPPAKLVIPSTYTSGGTTYTVTKIAANAFKGKTTITSVTLPTKLQEIGANAFSGCTNLKTVTSFPSTLAAIRQHAFSSSGISGHITLPASLTTLEYAAFYRCKNLTLVTLSNSTKLTTAGSAVFRECPALTAVSLPASLKTIGARMFMACPKLNRVTINQTTSQLTTIGEEAFSGCKALVTMTFPNKLQTIQKKAFYEAGLNKLYTMPATLTTLASYAFAKCPNLPSMTLKTCKKLTRIGDEAFSQCPNFTAISLPDSLTTICPKAFYQNTKLNRVTIVSSATKLSIIGANAFYGCKALKTFDFAKTKALKNIRSYAFAGSALSGHITLPASLETLEKAAFYRCLNLQLVTLSGCVKLVALGEAAFRECTSMTAISLPRSLKTIGVSAFYDCKKLNRVTINAQLSALTTIGTSAFYNCTLLRTLSVPSSIALQANAFAGCSITITFVSVKKIGGKYATYVVASEDLPALYTGSLAPGVTVTTQLFTYDVANGAVTITGLTDPHYAGAIEIPETIGRLLVKAIGCDAFRGSTCLRMVTIPATVTAVGDGAFVDCGVETIIFEGLPPEIVYSDDGQNIGIVTDGAEVLYSAPYADTWESVIHQWVTR